MLRNKDGIKKDNYRYPSCSSEYGNEDNGLGCLPNTNTVTLNRRVSRLMKFRTHMKCTTIHRSNYFVRTQVSRSVSPTIFSLNVCELGYDSIHPPGHPQNVDPPARPPQKQTHPQEGKKMNAQESANNPQKKDFRNPILSNDLAISPLLSHLLGKGKLQNVHWAIWTALDAKVWPKIILGYHFLNCSHMAYALQAFRESVPVNVISSSIGRVSSTAFSTRSSTLPTPAGAGVGMRLISTLTFGGLSISIAMLEPPHNWKPWGLNPTEPSSYLQHNFILSSRTWCRQCKWGCL